MQRNFNPHLPPGYLETHELEGVSWKSAQPVRGNVSERAMAQVVRKFNHDSWTERNRQRKENICATIRKNYRIRDYNIEVIQQPHDAIPCLLPGDGK